MTFIPSRANERHFYERVYVISHRPPIQMVPHDIPHFGSLSSNTMTWDRMKDIGSWLVKNQLPKLEQFHGKLDFFSLIRKDRMLLEVGMYSCLEYVLVIKSNDLFLHETYQC